MFAVRNFRQVQHEALHCFLLLPFNAYRSRFPQFSSGVLATLLLLISGWLKMPCASRRYNSKKKGVKNMSVIKKAALVVAAVVCAAMTATPANNSEQVVFSDTGALMTLVGNSKAATTPFGVCRSGKQRRLSKR